VREKIRTPERRSLRSEAKRSPAVRELCANYLDLRRPSPLLRARTITERGRCRVQWGPVGGPAPGAGRKSGTADGPRCTARIGIVETILHTPRSDRACARGPGNYHALQIITAVLTFHSKAGKLVPSAATCARMLEPPSAESIFLKVSADGGFSASRNRSAGPTLTSTIATISRHVRVSAIISSVSKTRRAR